MNYFELYPGDYLRDTTRLTLVEHGAYMRLLMAYYSDEQPLPAEKDELFRVVSALKSDEKKAVLSVADRYFPVGEDGLRHNARADAEIAKASTRMDSRAERKSSEAERQQRYRDRRKALFESLRAVGITPAYNTSTDELLQLVTENVTQQTVTNVTPSHRDTTATTRQTPDPIQEQKLSPHAPFSPDPLASETTPTKAGRACLLLRQAGCAKVNASHPDLLAALAEGVTPEAIRDAFTASPNARNPFAYAIATARGLHADGAKTTRGANHVHANGGTGRKLSAVEQVQQAILERRAREQSGDDAPPAISHG